jgi:cytochrome c biogenesis protein CcmG, thiol:disulfide interchange protein DsbE
MKRMFKDWGLALLIAAVVFFLVRLIPNQGQPDLPDQAPGFELSDASGGSLTLADFRGQTVVLNFWATWCGPCRQETPAFAAFHEAHPDVPLIGVVTDAGDPGKVRRTIKTWGITWPDALDDGTASALYDVTVLPTTVIVGPDGQVRSAHVGGLTQRDLESAVF